MAPIDSFFFFLWQNLSVCLLSFIEVYGARSKMEPLCVQSFRLQGFTKPFTNSLQIILTFNLNFPCTNDLKMSFLGSNFFKLKKCIYNSKGGVLYLAFRPRTSLQCFDLYTLCSKAKHCRDVLGRKSQIENPSLRQIFLNLRLRLLPPNFITENFHLSQRFGLNVFFPLIEY